MLIKFQARVRGMLTRNKLKVSPKYRVLFSTHGKVKEGTPMYKNAAYNIIFKFHPTPWPTHIFEYILDIYIRKKIKRKDN